MSNNLFCSLEIQRGLSMTSNGIDNNFYNILNSIRNSNIQQKYCHNCGKGYKLSDNYCLDCGIKLEI
ncbi:hypothetical protein LCGC14_0762530 [marine sediment metagenome]|uniref:Zinc-ribbon domain-containing protein n=1 Tax=marine sediment metagenome TaxID=412755 RepID=A0A0F9QKI7_9ZZZZ|nr:MAG: hypothetical protein Lokiarch_18510 [Candidatus Lokiarchaeum sp. GC14_75]